MAAYSLYLRPCSFPEYQISGFKVLWLVLATVLIAAAGNIINDIQDVKIDQINKPSRLIVEKYISRKQALLLYGVFTFAGLVFASLVDFQYFIWTLIAAQVLWLYSVLLKCQPLIGNIAIAFLMGLSVWVVQFTGEVFIMAWILFYSAFAFLTGFIREIIKDLEDKNGDEACGCHTFANTSSLQKVKNLIYILLAAGIVLLLVSAIFMFYKGLIYLPLYLLLVISTAFIFYGLLVKKAKDKEQFSRLSFYIKIIMLAGILSMPLAKYYY
ncbi:MAG: geranylgeranylglycerol-phosphate geranylgeranyltransferase [Bacteroidia bacterium]